jgi:hypothetical protein
MTGATRARRSPASDLFVARRGSARAMFRSRADGGREGKVQPGGRECREMMASCPALMQDGGKV